ncbi:MAG: hypothetical protein KJ709_05865 [Nanoarchaeota archaeon]|nr:hypothetical protein [Nanoarchaeota archaeon]
MTVPGATPPVVNLDKPLNDTWLQAGTVIFNYTAADPTLQNCTLYGNFDGAWKVNETNETVVNGKPDTVQVNLNNGSYLWNVLCYDANGNSAWNSTNYTVHIDNTYPWINLNGPINNSNHSNTYLTFNWTAGDAVALNLTCNLTINGTVNRTGIIVGNNSAYNFTVYGFLDGTQTWNVTCWDNLTLTNTSVTRTFRVDSTSPVVNLVAPRNDTWLEDELVTFNYTTSDDYLENCTLYGDFSSTWKANETNLTVANGKTDTVSILLPNGTYKWNVLCYDNVGNSAWNSTNFSMHVDNFPPAINLNWPPNAHSFTVNSLNFNWTAVDNVALNLTCNITINGTVNGSGIAVSNGSRHNYSVTGFLLGTQSWNVTCWDELNHTNTSVTRTFTRTVIPPTVTLVSPNTTYASISPHIQLTCNATDDDTLKNLTLYNNRTGTWGENGTVSLTGSGQEVDFNLTNVDNGVIMWNCLAYDTMGGSGWYDKNRTFELNNTFRMYEKLGIPAHPFDYSAEANETEYNQVNESNNDRWVTDLATSDSQQDSQVFIFNLSYMISSADEIEYLNLTWRGYGETEAAYHTNVSFWNWTGGEWVEYNNTDFTAASDKLINITILTGATDFVNTSTLQVAVLVTTRKHVAGAECGNGILEGDEVCDSDMTNPCTKDPDYFQGGYVKDPDGPCVTAIACKFDCSNCLALTNCISIKCFVAGTDITMADGSLKDIKDVRVGDVVMSLDMETWEVEPNTVLELLSPMHEDMVHLTFENAENWNTFDHPYYVKGKGWSSYKPELTESRYGIDTAQLEEGDICYRLDENLSIAESGLLSIEEDLGEVQTYNLQKFDNNNNYFANGVLVHNCPLPDDYSFQGGGYLDLEQPKNAQPAHRSLYTDEITLGGGIDQLGPVINLDSPGNDTWLPTPSVTFAYTVTDAKLKNCTLWGNFDGTWQANASNTTIVSGQQSTVTNRLVNGSYVWNVRCFDTAGNSAWNATNFTLHIDSIGPKVSLNNPADGMFNDNESMDFRWTADDNLDKSLTCNLTINSTNNGTNIAVTNGSAYSHRPTDFADGTHLWNVTCWDSANSTNISTETGEFTIDTTYPAVSWINPTPSNNQNTDNRSVLLNTTITDTHNTSAFFDWNRSLVGYWSMDQHNSSGVHDNSSYGNAGRFSGGLSTSNITTGKYGKGLTFDGVDDWVEIDTINDDVNVNAGTIEGWGRMANYASGVYETFVALYADNSNRIFIEKYTDDEMEFYHIAGGTADHINIDVSSYSGWHHWVMTWDTSADELKAYIDGVQVGTTQTGLGTFSGTPVDSAIGVQAEDEQPAWDEFWNGAIDEVRIYSRALSQEEINASYNNAVYRLYHNFTDLKNGTYNYSAYVIDVAGNLNITPTRKVTVDTGAPTVTLNQPVNGTWHTSDLYTFAYTATDFNLDNCTLYGNFDGTWKANATNKTVVTDQQATVTFKLRNGSYIWNVHCYDTLASNSWASQNFTLYVDSVPPAITLNLPPDQVKTSDTWINYYWQAVDGLAFNISCNLTINGTINSSDINLTNGSLRNHSVSGFLEGMQYWNVTCWDMANNSNTSATRAFTVDTTLPTITWVNPTPSDGHVTNNRTVLLNTTITDLHNTSAFFDWNRSLVGYWSFEDVLANGTVYDNSTYKNRGTILNHVSNTTVTGKYGKALDFDGVNDYVDINDLVNDVSSDNTGTVMLWVDFPDVGAGGATGTFFSVSKGDTSNYFQMNVQNNKLRLALWTTSYITTKITTPTYETGWHHMVVTSNGSKTWLYVDGIEPALDEDTDSGKWFNDLSGLVYARIGGLRYNGEKSFNGSIDEVRIYNRVLSWAEVNASFNNGAYRLYRNFTDLKNGTYNYSAYAIDEAGNLKITGERTVTVDTGDPVVNLNAPANYTWLASKTVHFNYTAIDPNLANCTLYGNFDGTWKANETNDTAVSGKMDTIAIELSNGTYVWNVLCYDSVGQFAWNSTNYTLHVDSVVPAINLNWPADGYTTSNTVINFNWTATDNLALNLTCNLTINGTVNASYIAVSNGSANNYSVSGFLEGMQYWNVTCSDLANNSNTSETRAFTVDTSGPTIAGITESADPVGYGFNITISATITDANTVNASIVQITEPGGTPINFTMITQGSNVYAYNFSGWKNGSHSYKIFANDSLNNWAVSSVALFDIMVNLSVKVRTLKDVYGANEIVNITDPPGGWGVKGSLDRANAYIQPVVGKMGGTDFIDTHHVEDSFESSSFSSLKVYDLTSDCSLKCLSSDQTGMSSSAASARNGASLGCEIVDKTASTCFLNTFLNFTILGSSSIIELNSSLFNPEILHILSEYFLSSDNALYGEHRSRSFSLMNLLNDSESLNKENSMFVSTTSSIYGSSLYDFHIDSFSSLASLSTSFSDSLLFLVSLDNLSSASSLLSLARNSSLPISDQFIHENFPILDFNSSSTANVTLAIYISPLLFSSSNFSSSLIFLIIPLRTTSATFMSGWDFLNLANSSSGIDTVILGILVPPSIYLNESNYVDVFKSFAPTITNAYVQPEDVKPGDTMLVSADVVDHVGITSVTAKMPHEKGSDMLSLDLANGTIYDGTWQEYWGVHDTIEKAYITTIVAENEVGGQGEARVRWTDAVASYDFGDTSDKSAYRYNATAIPTDPYVHDEEASSGEYTNLSASDNAYFSTTNATSDSDLDMQIFIFNISDTINTVTNLTIIWEGYGETQAGYYTNISFYNWSNGQWFEVNHTDFTSASDITVTATLGGVMSDFINSSTKEVAVLVTSRKYVEAGAVCGNGVIEGDETCDAGDDNGGSASCGTTGCISTRLCTISCTCQTSVLCEEGSPFLYTYQDNEYTFLSDFIPGATSKEKEYTSFTDISRTEIVDNKLKLKITEELDETTYLDRIYLRVDGSEIVELSSVSDADISLLKYSDDNYLVMNQGDVYYLEFDAPESYGKLEFAAEGYYVEHYRNNVSHRSLYTDYIKLQVTKTGLNYDEFSGHGDTTDLSGVGASDVNISVVLADNNGLGKIEFSWNVSINNTFDLDSAINITDTGVSVDTATYPSLNVPANLTLRNLPFGYPQIKKDGSPCADCTILGWDTNKGVLKFNVSGFSEYTASEANQSKVENLNLSNTSFFVLMRVQKYSAGSWGNDVIIVNDTVPRSILYSNGSQLKLDALFNGRFNTSQNCTGNGTYRVIVNLTNGSDAALVNYDGAVLSATYEFDVDGDPPHPITLNYPASGASISLDDVNFNWTVIDNLDRNLTCNLTLDGILNQSDLWASNNSPQNVTVYDLAQGAHTWNVTCEDDAFNMNTSITQSFTISLGALNITFNETGTEPNASFRSWKHIPVAVNITGTNLANVTYFLYNKTSQAKINETTLGKGNWSINFTDRPEGEYLYNATAETTSNNKNSTPTRNITLDVTPPTWTNNNTNETLFTPKVNDTIRLNVSLADNFELDWYIFSWNHSGEWLNYSPVDISGTSYLVQENLTVNTTGKPWVSWRIHFNDSAGNRNQTDIVRFKMKNTLPRPVTLYSPLTDNHTVNRTPIFVWNHTFDADNDTIYYNISVEKLGGDGSCSVADNRNNQTTRINITLDELLCLYDETYYYNWSVIAWDGENYSNTWSTEWNISIDSYVSVLLLNSSVDFGSSLNLGEEKNTTDGSRNPFLLENDGNVLENVNITATELWDTAAMPTENYQFKTNDSTEGRGFDATTSKLTWTNVPLITGSIIAVGKFDYHDTNDTARVDIKVNVPVAELPGNKSSIVTFEARRLT